ncbi:hypothetical protein Egran_03074 [Elaphomyces granulatus]|uniref:pyridoxal kinase n=1 Tax=Elaphomyces granulatus TaxID=519963 RepID=A0A232LYB6_9EURO|nr:hypothetical protein Egran_03074 [Elaphomyces granulatus]
MSLQDEDLPETRVLAIASHLFRYVGNTMATFVMQSLGCEVAALNTVQFSNHTGYRQVKGTETTAQEIMDLYQGLRQSYLVDFDVLLSGYAPNAAAVRAAGEIGLDLQRKAKEKPGSFFWVLDPVMGDQGQRYVNEDVVPAYKDIICHADLILPNQFEAESAFASRKRKRDAESQEENLTEAITEIHRIYSVPHVVVTSAQLSNLSHSAATPSTPPSVLTVIGSTVRSDGSPRLFRIDVPALDCFFNGTGDMFAALTVARLREAVFAADPTLRHTKSWISPDDIVPTSLPLARATEKVLASMHSVLEKTMEARDLELRTGNITAGDTASDGSHEHSASEDAQKREHLWRTKAAEVRLVRNVKLLRNPVVESKVQEWSE